MLKRIGRQPDFWAVLVLIALWLLFFWRIFTPDTVDALSLREGDFSGQFVSWTSYSADRINKGEIPLWNPYIHAGAPLLADPQTAVLYPPRLLTIKILDFDSSLTNGEIYAALQTEMMSHVLLGLLFMYAFLRRVTTEILSSDERQGNLLARSITPSMAGSLIFAFGGFLSAYPALQIPILETAIWSPLVLLGLHEATRPSNENVGWWCVVLAGVALALALLAGHPQTFLLLGYTSLAYLIYRLWRMEAGWLRGLLAIFLFGIVAAGLSAAQWLPTLQFQTQTYRDGLSFDDKGGGFVFQDVVQFVFPGMLSEWSPLYLGIPGLLLVMLALWRQMRGAIFWSGVLCFGLLLSFGQRLIIYDVVYILLPGFSFFRGQERSVFLVALAGSILAALGTFALLNTAFSEREGRYLRRVSIAFILLCAMFATIFFVLRLMPPDGEIYQPALGSALFSLLMSILTLLVLFTILRQPASNWLAIGLAALIVFDLFSVNMGNSNFEAIPADERLPEPAYIDTIKGNLDPGQHVEGLRGIRDSYGALYRVPDIWGNSPLRFDAVEFYLWQIPIERRWELLGVQVVNSEWTELPVPYTLIGTGEDEEGPFNLFRLENPRPFAHPVFVADVVGDEERARERLADLDYDLRNRVVLEENPGPLSELPDNSDYQVTVDTFEPEHIKLQTESAVPAVLTLALPYDSGWQVTVDGEEAELLNAYAGLSAVYIEDGSHTVELRYKPWTFQVGIWSSFITLLVVITSFVFHLVRSRRRQESSEG